MKTLFLCFFGHFYPVILAYEKTILKLRNDSAYSLPELWEIQNPTSSPAYEKNDGIDEWDTNPPNQIVLFVKDVHGKNMFVVDFNTTGSSSNITSWLSYDRVTSMFPSIKSPYFFQTRKNRIEMIDQVRTDMVYFAHGKYNDTVDGQFIGFAKTESPFSLEAAVTNTKFESQTFFSHNYQNSSGFTEYYINLHDALPTYYFLRGIAVYNIDDTNMTYSFAYTPRNGQCRADFRTSTNYVFAADGKLNTMDVVKAVCVWIYLSGTAYNINITLNEPAEDYILGYRILMQAHYADPTVPETTPDSIISTKTLSETTEMSTTQGMLSIETIETSTENQSTSSPDTLISTKNLWAKNTEISTTQGMLSTKNTETSTKYQSTPSNHTTTCCNCECNQKTQTNKYAHLQNLTQEELEEALKNFTEQIKKELTVDTKTLSSTIRKKISADDKRPSARRIGYVGALVLGIELAFIVLLDHVWYKQLIWQFFQMMKSFKNKLHA